MFKINTSGSYKRQITVEMNGENGRKEKSTFNVYFARQSQTQLSTLASDKALTFEDLMNQVLTGWDGIVGEDGQALDFNEATRAIVFEIPEVRFALREDFWASVALGKQKN